MKYLKLLLLQLLICFGNICISQTYIGKNSFGRLEILNDSTCNLSFHGTGGTIITSECFCSKSKDTLFISSKITSPWIIKYSEKKYPKNQGYPQLIKVYSYVKNKYQLMIEGCYGIYDTILNKLIIQDLHLESGDLIVVKDGPIYWRFKVGSEFTKRTKSIIVDDQNSDISELYFDKFPLLVRSKKLIPCGNKNQLENCWLNNGFYFPVMHQKKADSKFKTIQLWSIGLQGLPYFTIKQ